MVNRHPPEEPFRVRSGQGLRGRQDHNQRREPTEAESYALDEKLTFNIQD